MALYEIDNVPAPIDFAARGPERILRNIKNLLMTKMGEVPYDRMRGLDGRLTNLPMDRMREELLPELDRMAAWEPRATVAAAEARMLEDGSVYIRVTVRV